MKKLILLVGALTLSACSQKSASEISDVNLRTNKTPVDSIISEFRVVRNDQVSAEISKQHLLNTAQREAVSFLNSSSEIDPRFIYQGTFPTEDVLLSKVDAANDTLILGLPIGILGEERVLGGVVTTVENRENEDLGSLKLSDLPMIHGKLMLAAVNTNQPQLILVGCAENCTEASPRVPLIGFPILAIDSQKKLLMIDLSAVGRTLDLITLLDPTGADTGMKSISAVAKTFDYSEQTVVFDVESKLTGVGEDDEKLPDTNITVRWYLKSAAAFDPAFEPREATPGVGYFMTSTAATPKIKRWSMARYGESGIKYYIKNVPVEWQPAFAASFDAWNASFEKLFSRKIFDYEFIAENDPRYSLLVPGDIRYNIVEWDLVNKAGYGGLGPSFASEFTGEDLSTNVLIQGPTIMQLYSSWFKVSAKAEELKKQGQPEAADRLIRDFSKSAETKKARHRLMLGKKSFRINAELPELEDPIAQRNDFEELPPGVDFKTYMNGYFQDMLIHELGHNLGLRHNFRGNMGATDTGEKGSTSRSVMEYLGRRYRYLDQVGEYDLMALQYGYGNVKPAHLDWFCTDENAWNAKKPETSPECSPDDATQDPYSFFEFRLSQVVDKLTARGQSYAPVWTQEDMARELGIALKGLLSYASLNEKNAVLSNFYGKGGRPSDLKQVKEFVIARIGQQLCDPNLEMVVASKYEVSAKKLTQENIQKLREKALDFFSKAGVDLGFKVSCSKL